MAEIRDYPLPPNGPNQAYIGRKFRKITLFIMLLSSPVLHAANEPASAISSHELIKVIGGLLLVIVIILALSWILKRLNASALLTSSGFKPLASMSLGTREKIMLIRTGEQFLLLGVTAGSINLLHDFGNTLPPGFDVGKQTSFADLIKSVTRKP